jgi:YidC/Oxa1 family membrane protein insertase
MPLLFALYFVFRGAFELRGASFVAWITDLSVPDSIMTLPFNIWMYGHQVSLLAIIFALSSFLSMRMTTTASTDPQQKMMLYIMPAFMLLFFNQMPSGLTLYYTLFNFLTIAQQQWLTPPSTVVPETLVMADSVKMKRKKS